MSDRRRTPGHRASPLYLAFSTTGVGFQVDYAIDQVVAGTWTPGYKPFGLAMGSKASNMIICGGTPEQKAKLEAIKKDILDGKIKVLKDDRLHRCGRRQTP